MSASDKANINDAEGKRNFFLIFFFSDRDNGEVSSRVVISGLASRYTNSINNWKCSGFFWNIVLMIFL